MKQTGKEMSVGEFASILGVSRQTLIYYDRIGLFRPARVDGATGYRYYTRRQIGVMSFILTLSALGVPLGEIRREVAHIRPERMERLLRRQRETVRREMEKLRRIEEVISQRLGRIEASRRVRTGETALVHEAAAPLFVSEPLHCRKDAVPDRAFLDFYAAADREGIPPGFAPGYLVAEEDILRGRGDIAGRLVFRLGGADGANAVYPAGTFLIRWEHAEWGGTCAVYEALLAAARARGLVPAGDALEEYYLDETAAERPADFLCRIALPVNRKAAGG